MCLMAQDFQRLSERDIVGTARYVGLAGAMTAVGGDPSAVLDNPAGLGIYRRMETSFTFDEIIDLTGQCSAQVGAVAEGYRSTKFAVPHASIVFSLEAVQESQVMKYCNFMIGFNRLRTFNRMYSASLSGSMPSLADMIAEDASGLPETAVDIEKGWNDENIGWLTLLGYGAYMIDPDKSSMRNQWVASEDAKNIKGNELHVEEAGYVDEFNFNWGANLQNHWYIGLGMAIRSLSYLKTTNYWEDFTRGGMYMRSSVTQTGIGVGGSVGLMYQPASWVRLGASFATPTWMNVRLQSDGDMSRITADNIRVDSTLIVSPAWNVNTNIVQPMRVTAGAAFILGQRGLLSLEYDYRHWKDPLHDGVEDMHMLKAGVEVNFFKSMFIEAGYAYESTFNKGNRFSYHWEPTSTRTDPDYLNFLGSHYLGVSLGYRGANCIAQLGYQLRWQQTDLFAHAYQSSPFEMASQTHRIVLTLGWHSK